MYKVLFSQTFEDDLKKFLKNLKVYYFNLYTDTGIASEDIILQNYDHSFQALVSLIRQQIEFKGKTGLLGRRMINKNKLEETSKSHFYIRSYRIEFQSRKNDTNKIIFVDSLKITT